MQPRTVLISVLSILMFSVSQATFGAGYSTTSGGANGTIQRVTNLNPSGPGSLGAAISASGPRVVVFETSGTITLTDWLVIRDPDITIAGQTAPSPGITIRGAGIRVNASNVLIQHLRIRVGNGPGPDPGSRDGLEILANRQTPVVHDVVIDHCSFSWAIDENVSVYIGSGGREIYNVDIVDCIISEALMEGHPNPGHQSDGWLYGTTGEQGVTKVIRRVSGIGNLLAYNNARNPTTQASHAAFLNNYVVGPGGKVFLIRAESGSVPTSAFVGNVVESRTHTRARQVFELDAGLPSSWGLYLQDNVWPVGMPLANGTVRNLSSYDLPDVAVIPAVDVPEFVLDHVGARPRDRDEVDERLIESIRSGGGSLIGSQDEVGGWPALVVNSQHFESEADIEAQLARLAAELEGDIVTEPATCSISAWTSRKWTIVEWETTNAEFVMLNGVVVPASGTKRELYKAGQTYSLSAAGPGGACASSATVPGRSDR